MTDVEQAINHFIKEGYFDWADAVVALVTDYQRLKEQTWAQAGEIDQLAAENYKMANQIRALQGRLYLNNLPHDVLEETE